MFIIPLLYSARIIDPLTARDLQKQEVYLIELSFPRKKKRKWQKSHVSTFDL